MNKKFLYPIASVLLSGFSFFVRATPICVSGDNQWNTLAAFTTYFNTKDVGRCENIAVASELIDGVTLQAYGDFSFNQTVGRRTEQSGFKQAKIIVDGQYVLGVGGGVCQVSTTLYNAALLSGLVVAEYHPHSLQVGYVPPSRDAMVSSCSDLKLYNPYGFAVRLRVTVNSGSVTAKFLGERKGYDYAIVSQVLGQTPPPAPIVKDGEEDGILRAEKNGVKSESYLETYQNGVLVSRKRLRKDEYLAIQGIVVKKNVNPRE